jgi:hypothetical protein
MLAKATVNQEKMVAERKADQEKVKGMMKACQERMDTNKKAIKEDIKSGQEEMRSIVGAFQRKMDACVASRRDDRKETTSCQEMTEANTEKTEPNPGTIQSVEEYHEVPKEEAAVMPVGGLRKWRRDLNQAVGHHQTLKGSIQASCEFSRRLTIAGRKMFRRVAVAQCKRNVFRKIQTVQAVCRRRNKDDLLCKSGTRQGTQAAETSKRRHCTREHRKDERRRINV